MSANAARLAIRVARLEAAPAAIGSAVDVSILSDDELRLLASMVEGPGGMLPASPEDAPALALIATKLEQHGREQRSTARHDGGM